MRHAKKYFRGLTVADVMRRAAVVLPKGMSVAAATRLLSAHKIRVAPVTDISGRCVGVLSVMNILQWAGDGDRADGEEADSVWCEWQVVDFKEVRRDEVRRHMTRDPLLVAPDMDVAAIVGTLSRRPVVVVDQERRPLGVVSSNGVLAALTSDALRPDETAATGRRFSPQRSIQSLHRA